MVGTKAITGFFMLMENCMEKNLTEFRRTQNSPENELIILPKATLDAFLETDMPADLISLYTFYYYTAKWQGTNQPKAVDVYVKKGLKWGTDRLRRAKQRLIDMDLIEHVAQKDQSGKIMGWYVRLNYIWSNNSVKNHMTENPLVVSPTSGLQAANALSSNKLNALSSNNKMLEVRLDSPGLENPKGSKKNKDKIDINKQVDITLANSFLTGEKEEPDFFDFDQCAVRGHRPTKQQVDSYCLYRGYPTTLADSFFTYMNKNNWEINGAPVDMWILVIDSWQKKHEPLFTPKKINKQSESKNYTYKPQKLSETEWWMTCCKEVAEGEKLYGASNCPHCSSPLIW